MLIPRIWLVALMIVLLVSITFNCRFLMKVHDFGTVDVQKLINIEAQKLASIYPKGEVPQEKLQALIDHVRAIVQNTAQKRNMVLLSKGVVLSLNVPDCTDLIIKALEDELHE